MTLNELINLLSDLKANRSDNNVIFGFNNPHSYRGYYVDLAFEPAILTSIDRMITISNATIGRVYTGWKGGSYLMNRESKVWLANRGDCGIEMTEPLIISMFNFPQWNNND